MEDSLAGQIVASGASDNRLRVGIYNSATGQVMIQGVPVTAGKLDSAVPTNGAVVAVMRQDKTWLILGTIS